MNLLRTLPNLSGAPDDLLGGAAAAQQLSGAITDSLIMGMTDDVMDDDTGQPDRPRQVKRVLDALIQDPAKAWTLADMAEIAGVSGRRLQQSFRSCLELSPTEYLRDLRLTLTHRDLLEAPEGALVRDIAARWGFAHMGRFSLMFKKKFGLPPSSVPRHQHASSR